MQLSTADGMLDRQRKKQSRITNDILEPCKQKTLEKEKLKQLPSANSEPQHQKGSEDS